MSAERRVEIKTEPPPVEYDWRDSAETLDHVVKTVQRVIRHQGNVPLLTRLEIERILYKAEEIIVHERRNW